MAQANEINFYSAPLDGLSDQIWRRYILREVPEWDWVFTPFFRLPSASLFSTKTLVAHIGSDIFEDQKLMDKTVLQILLGPHGPLEQQIQTINQMGIKRLNINLGCPGRKVVAHQGGAFWLKELPLLAEKLKIIRQNFQGHLSAKIRSGFDHLNLDETLNLLNQEKIDQVILHPRLSTQLYHGRANWALFQTAREIFPELVVNGDICTLKDLSNVSNYSSEIMIGRGAIANPWLPQEYLQQKEFSLLERRNQIHQFVSFFVSEMKKEKFPESTILQRIKALGHYFLEKWPDKKSKVLRSQNLSEALDYL